MEAVVAFPAGNFETHVNPPFSPGNRLFTFRANNVFLGLHGSPLCFPSYPL
jgi:hypothetical protein